jgi:hypothetical protein
MTTDPAEHVDPTAAIWEREEPPEPEPVEGWLPPGSYLDPVTGQRRQVEQPVDRPSGRVP